MEKKTDDPYFITFANEELATVKRLYESTESEGGNLLPEVSKSPFEKHHGRFYFIDGLMVDGRIIPERMAKFISRVWDAVRNILDQIIHSNGQLIESDRLKFIIKLKERQVSEYKIVNGRLIETKGIFDDDKRRMAVSPQWLIHVPSSLVDFLLKGDLWKLKQCSDCKLFYIATKNNPRQKYCPVCSRKNKMTAEEKAVYMKGYRANTARKKAIAKKKREEKIRRLMTNAGKTRKEAELSMDDDV